MNQDFNLQRKAKLPGPGEYEPKDEFEAKMPAQPVFKFGTGKRLSLGNETFIPGPGNYFNLSDSFTKIKSPMYGFGSSVRQSIEVRNSNTKLGPGAYDLPQVIGKEGTRNSLSPKLKDLREPSYRARNLPGPGQYDTSFANSIAMKTLPSYKIGTSKRPEPILNFTGLRPSPTAYNPNDSFTKPNISANIKFGTSKRPSIDKSGAEKLPGPGEYKIPSAVVSENPRFAMGVKIKEVDKKSFVPGPG